MTSYDLNVYEEAGSWHFQILKLMEGRAGPSTVVYMSRAENRRGYPTKEEATKAGLDKKFKMPSN